MPDKTYVGTRKGEWVDTVTVNDQRLFNYDKHADPENGFEWGYGGAGPSALALSIICDHNGIAPGEDPQRHFYSKPSLGFVQMFKEEVIAHLPHDGGFTLTSEQIAEWIAKKSDSRASTSRS